MNHLENIRRFSRDLKIELSYSGNSNGRVHFMTKCIGGDFLGIPLSPAEDEFTQAQSHCWILTMKVMVKRAKLSYEHAWRWRPGEVSNGTIGFHHWDHAMLLENVSNWLNAHEDHKTGLVAAYPHNKGDESPMLAAVKCQAIGSILHYTTMEEFKDE